MKFLARILVAVLANGLGLLAAAKWVPGFTITSDARGIVTIAVVLTVLNFVLKPVLRLILGPVIFLTLGLGLILVNALVLYVLTLLSPGLTISGIPAYLFAAIIMGAVNFIFHLATKS